MAVYTKRMRKSLAVRLHHDEVMFVELMKLCVEQETP